MNSQETRFERQWSNTFEKSALRGDNLRRNAETQKRKQRPYWLHFFLKGKKTGRQRPQEGRFKEAGTIGADQIQGQGLFTTVVDFVDINLPGRGTFITGKNDSIIARLSIITGDGEGFKAILTNIDVTYEQQGSGIGNVTTRITGHKGPHGVNAGHRVK